MNITLVANEWWRQLLERRNAAQLDYLSAADDERIAAFRTYKRVVTALCDHERAISLA